MTNTSPHHIKIMSTSQDQIGKTKPDARHTLLRHWHLLKKIPRYPKRISIEDLFLYLKDEYFEVSRRTIERDLQKLSETFPMANDGAKPSGWYWLKDATALSLPALTATEALTFKLVKEHLADLMPVSVLTHLEPFFEQAEREFQSLNQNPLQDWPNKIAAVPSSQPLLPPAIGFKVQQAVSEALLHDRQLRLLYQNKEEITPSERIVNPLAMVSRAGVIYLISSAADSPETIRLRLMHRIHSAEVLDAPTYRPDHFDLQAFIDSGQFGFGQGKTLKLKVAFLSETALHLRDTPLSLDQAIVPYDQDRVLVTATIADTQQLTWWLLGFGDKVEVLEPSELRQKIAEIAVGMNHTYKNTIKVLT